MTYNEKSIDYACNTACKDCLSTTCDKESIYTVSMLTVYIRHTLQVLGLYKMSYVK